MIYKQLQFYYNNIPYDLDRNEILHVVQSNQMKRHTSASQFDTTDCFCMTHTKKELMEKLIRGHDIQGGVCV